ncbi:DUF4214 domain-containing protein [Herbaspirillum sp. SJZ107]|uniref:DUF4214 domain-containing protein n=1 Tax=Herbaspirillum sp. SJZ107 TaxID=2572881 RepID=UPI00114DA8D3|nr:DUF4214 domain-containing protein [Herbaspirillum sp. SJZ107]TQK10604.1 uncharacterized protein DUF4214 [Herbaspirillum sp. SJZ107]
MTTPATLINVRPGYASTTWNYAGATPAGASPVAAVAFDASSSLGQAASRGDLQFSLDAGKTWSNYALPVDGKGAYVAASGALGATLWRFQDRQPGDSVTPDSFNVHYRLADGSIATFENTVVVDNQPVGLTGSYDILFTTMQAGDVADVLLPVDTGALTGGRWVIDSQSQPGLFAVAYDRAVDTSGRLVIANAALLPASGGAASATLHYYDRYQVDAGGNPLPNTGVTRTLTYTVEDGSTRDLAGFANEARLGAGSDAPGASPSVATLSTGGFVTVWQGPDAALWAQTRDAAGNALGANFALTPNGGAAEGQPAVSALAGGRFVVAYTLHDGGANKIAYRVVEAGGSAGAEHVVDGGAAGDASMPAVATLADGSFAVAWRSGGTVHVQQAAADGSAIGAVHDAGALGSAYSPDLVALKEGGYVLAWGEINDGNVYASINGGTPIVASGDGYAASIMTAAPLPHVTALAGGGFVVAWDSYMNDPHGFSISDIYFQRFDGAGHALGELTQANVDAGGGRYDAAVAALSDGGFVVTWQGSDDAGNGIFGRRFGADGSALDPHEFAVSQHRAGDQAGADVSALAGGGFVTAWVDTAAGGSVGVEMRVLQGQVADGSAAHLSTTLSSAALGTSPLPAIVGNTGNDAMGVPAGAVVLDGGAGLDTAVYSGARASFTVAHEGSGFSVTDAKGDHATLQNIERVQFGDGMVALDIDGTAGQAYRLYQAAFDRTPDKVGLGFWIDVLDHGAPLQDAARDFVGSQEFKDLYGANLSDAQFVDALYQNVLHRPAEGAGFDFWMSSLQIVSRAEVLVNFSESAENQAQVVGSIQNGIDYVHWAG